jgi:hypothetical protein
MQNETGDTSKTNETSPYRRDARKAAQTFFTASFFQRLTIKKSIL